VETLKIIERKLQQAGENSSVIFLDLFLKGI